MDLGPRKCQEEALLIGWRIYRRPSFGSTGDIEDLRMEAVLGLEPLSGLSRLCMDLKCRHLKENTTVIVARVAQ